MRQEVPLSTEADWRHGVQSVGTVCLEGEEAVVHEMG
jgi:hypothetical protein